MKCLLNLNLSCSSVCQARLILLVSRIIYVPILLRENAKTYWNTSKGLHNIDEKVEILNVGSLHS